MNDKIPRRVLLKAVICGATVIPAATLWRGAKAAAPLPLLTNADPTAQALGYVANAAKVDPKTNPTYMPGQQCAGCAQYQGKPADKQGPCILFPGKDVYAAGWCRGYAKKPA